MEKTKKQKRNKRPFDPVRKKNLIQLQRGRKIKIQIDEEQITKSGLDLYDILDPLLEALYRFPYLVEKLKKIETWQKMTGSLFYPKGTYTEDGKRISHLNKSYKGKRTRFDQRYEDRSEFQSIVFSIFEKHPNAETNKIVTMASRHPKMKEIDIDTYDERTRIGWAREILKRPPGRPKKNQ